MAYGTLYGAGFNSGLPTYNQDIKKKPLPTFQSNLPPQVLGGTPNPIFQSQLPSVVGVGNMQRGTTPTYQPQVVGGNMQRTTIPQPTYQPQVVGGNMQRGYQPPAPPETYQPPAYQTREQPTPPTINPFATGYKQQYLAYNPQNGWNIGQNQSLANNYNWITVTKRVQLAPGQWKIYRKVIPMDVARYLFNYQPTQPVISQPNPYENTNTATNTNPTIFA